MTTIIPDRPVIRLDGIQTSPEKPFFFESDHNPDDSPVSDEGQEVREDCEKLVSTRYITILTFRASS